VNTKGTEKQREREIRQRSRERERGNRKKGGTEKRGESQAEEEGEQEKRRQEDKQAWLSPPRFSHPASPTPIFAVHLLRTLLLCGLGLPTLFLCPLGASDIGPMAVSSLSLWGSKGTFI
jgi:hypothetical protein